jgi:hypothetical protein
MKRFYAIFVAMLVGATSLFAQTNYTVTFSANVELEKIQVKNINSGVTKWLYNPDRVITLQKTQNSTAIATVDDSEFLQQTGQNTVVVNMEKSGLLSLTLYSANGSMISHYSNVVNAGQTTFQIGATAGVYVLVAKADNCSSSVKLSLMQTSPINISEVASNSVSVLKSINDIIKFKEGDVFEFTGYHKDGTIVKTAVITENKEIVFNYFKNGVINAPFSVSENGKICFSQGNLQYQASTNKFRFAENQYDYIGYQNKNISSSYSGWIDLYGWGTSGWNSGAKAYQPYSTISGGNNYLSGVYASNSTGDYTNGDWGMYNKISNGGNKTGQWRTLSEYEWDYLINRRSNAHRLKGQGSVNNVNGLILLPDDWDEPASVKFKYAPDDYSTNVYTTEEWALMESYGAVFLPAAGNRRGTSIYNDGSVGYYWSNSWHGSNDYGYCSEWDGLCMIFTSQGINLHPSNSDNGYSVRLVQSIVPIVATNTDVTDITVTSATVGGNIADNGAEVVERGVCWNTSRKPTTSNNKKVMGKGIGDYSVQLSSLAGNTVYYARAYAINPMGVIVYGNEVKFTTAAGIPTIAIDKFDNYTYGTEIKISLIADNGATVTDKGVCWSESPLPTIADNHALRLNGDFTGNALVIMSTDRIGGVTYYARAYAINSVGIAYSSEISFTTPTRYPNVTTRADVTDITGNTAIVGGSVITDNGATVTERGVCWSTSPKPTIDDNKKVEGKGLGDYSVQLSSLAGSTTYYARAYAVNSLGTSYGEDVSFTTTISTPTIYTADVYMAGNALFIEGNVKYDGGAMVTEKGVCWSTSPDPTIADNKIIGGVGTGSFSVEITSLDKDTKYYVRTYAQNSEGITYSSVFPIITNMVKNNGAIKFVFSISPDKKIYFSQGNLQYQASTETWQFAKHQYDMIGKDNSNISSTYSGWIDLFGWGTSGWNSGANAYQPYSTSTEGSDYSPDGSYSNNLTGRYASADWGVYNKISNGGNATRMWRTLTSGEWYYVIKTRANASSKKGLASVNGVDGWILLPDNWTLPEGLTFTSEVNGRYAQNTYSTADWAKMEANGAVFLPAAGERYGTYVNFVGSVCGYWTSSANDIVGQAIYLLFTGYNVDKRGDYLGYGRPVRLVQDVE